MDLALGLGDVNWLAVLAAALSSVAIGAAWFGPLFGRRWAIEMGLDGMSEQARRAQLPRAMLLMVAGALLQAVALRFLLALAAGADSGSDQRLAWSVALGGGFAVWLGCFVPVQLGRVAWEGRSWRLFQINAAFYLLSLLLMVVILALWV